MDENGPALGIQQAANPYAVGQRHQSRQHRKREERRNQEKDKRSAVFKATEDLAIIAGKALKPKKAKGTNESEPPLERGEFIDIEA